MKVALCQCESVPNDVVGNTETAINIIRGTNADLFVFPELFITGYFYDKNLLNCDVGDALESIRSVTSSTGRCCVIGAPLIDNATGTSNCAFVIDDSIRPYRKIHLPNFPPFSEKERFSAGTCPMTFVFGGFTFGLSICYDVFFPELLKSNTLNGADVNICISASPVTSRKAFECILPARTVENTSYLVFVNNIGVQKDMEFFGGSRCISPSGDLMCKSEREGVEVVKLDKDALSDARTKRPVIADTTLQKLF